MRITRVIVGLMVLGGVGLWTLVPVRAHHAFAAEFDSSKPVKVRGTISKVEWTNPHSWIHVDVKNAEGKVERWLFEMGGPGSLTRRGIGKNYLAIGTEITVEGYLSRGVPRRANGRVMTYAGGPQAGQTLFLGSSGTGAPRDGFDPTEK